MRQIFLFTLLSAIALACAPAYAQIKPPPEKVTLQAGDIVLFISPNHVQRFINGVATGGEITHTGLIVTGTDGTLQIMHALGNDDGISYKYNPGEQFGVVIEPLMAALHKEQEVYGQHLILRPRKNPLSKEQNKALTAFAYRQKGKPYSSPKVAGPLIAYPFKNRPLITEPDSYMCSELACTALVAIGALPATINPPAITPFDFYDPARLDIPLWISKDPKNAAKPLVYAHERPYTYDPYLTPVVDKYGNPMKDKKRQGQFNPVEYDWLPPKPLLLTPPKITPTPDTFLNP